MLAQNKKEKKQMAFFSWPLAVVIILTVAFLIFKSAIIRLIDRISKVEKSGFTFERPQEGGTGNKQETPLLPSIELTSLPVTATVLDREKTIKTNLQSFNIKDDSKKIEILIRAVADSRIQIEFTYLAYTILGSQIFLLMHLSGTSQEIDLSQAEEIFKKAQESFPTMHANRTVNDWLKYLITTNLIIQTDNKIKITQYGTDFLKHLADAHLGFERIG